MSFWSSCLPQPLSRESNYRNRCITIIREVLLNSNIADVIIDVIINNIFAEYTLYGLCEIKNENESRVIAGAPVSDITQPEYKYKILDHGLNTNNIVFTNNRIFLFQDCNLYVSSSKVSDFHNNDIGELQNIGKSDSCQFTVCIGVEPEYEEAVTYLFDNKDRSFYSYNHQKNTLNKMHCKSFKSPPFAIKQIVKNLNNHKLAYYWCLMSNGMLFKIVFDHNFLVNITRNNHLRRRYMNMRQKNYISEFGPFHYHDQIPCPKHTVDLEVFRLIPTEIPKMMYMAAGGEHILFIDSENHLWVYGNNQFGQCGIKKTTDTIVQPIKNQIFKNIQIKHIFCGKNRSILIDDKGLCYIFGEGIDVDIIKPYKLLQSFEGFGTIKIVSADCGDEHFIFVDDKENIYGLGSNKYRQISCDYDVGYYNNPKLIEREYIGISDKKIEKISKVIVNGNLNYFITTRNVK